MVKVSAAQGTGQRKDLSVLGLPMSVSVSEVAWRWWRPRENIPILSMTPEQCPCPCPARDASTSLHWPHGNVRTRSHPPDPILHTAQCGLVSSRG